MVFKCRIFVFTSGLTQAGLLFGLQRDTTCMSLKVNSTFPDKLYLRLVSTNFDQNAVFVARKFQKAILNPHLFVKIHKLLVPRPDILS